MSEFSKEELLDCFDNMCLFLAIHGWTKKDKRVVEIREMIKNRAELNGEKEED